MAGIVWLCGLVATLLAASMQPLGTVCCLHMHIDLHINSMHMFFLALRCFWGTLHSDLDRLYTANNVDIGILLVS